MIAPRLFACLTFITVAGCAAPLGEAIGVSRLAITRDPGGSPTLEVPSCPNWRRDSAEDFSNRISSNFGCADAMNFLGQLATPSDALVGRLTGREAGSAAAASVERYRSRKTAPLAAGGETSGASAPSSEGPS